MLHAAQRKLLNGMLLGQATLILLVGQHLECMFQLMKTKSMQLQKV